MGYWLGMPTHNIGFGRKMDEETLKKLKEKHEELAKTLRESCKQIGGQVTSEWGNVGCKVDKEVVELSPDNGLVVYDLNNSDVIKLPQVEKITVEGNIMKITLKKGRQITFGDGNTIKEIEKEKIPRIVFEF